METNRICAICGKEFSSEAINQKCCSEKCSKERKRRRQKGYYHDRVQPKYCRACGKKFIPTPEYRYYCSVPCQMTRKKIGRTTCAYCGNPIIDKTASAKYCSDTCRRRANAGIPFNPEIAEKPRVSNIDDINTQAMEKGLSYGKFKALEWVKNNKYDILGENR